MPRLLLPTLAAASLLSTALPASAQRTRSPFDGDARLDHLVTVRWKKATLYDALREVGKETGVYVVPDRALVDEPLMASATKIPARVLLEQIGREFHYTWARSGGKPDAPGYLLYQDLAARKEEEDQINGARQAVLQALNAELEKYRRFSKMPQDEVDREVEKSDRELEQALQGGIAALGSNPATARRLQDGQALHSVASPVGRALLDLLNGLNAGQWNELQNEDSVVFSTQPAQGELQLPGGISDQMRQGTPGFPVPKSLFKALGPDVEKGISQVEGMMQEKWSRGSGFKVTVQLNLNAGAQPVGMLRVTPEPLDAGEIGPIFAATGLNLIGAPTLFPEQKEDPAEREKRLGADPVLGKKAVLKLPPLDKAKPGPFGALMGNAYRAADILPNIEEAFGVKIVGDAYNRLALSMVPSFGDQPVALYKVLDTVCGMTRDWERDGEVIRLRSRTWAHDRRGEIPVRYMRKWLETRTRKGGFALEDLAEIAAMLRDEQVESLMYAALEAGTEDFTDFIMVSANRDILRFYGKLLPVQRQTLLRGQRLAVRDLFPYQQKVLLGMNRGSGQSIMAAFMGGRGKHSPQQWAGATIGITRTDVPAPKPGEEANGPRSLPGMTSIGGVYLVDITFADGKKDNYPIPLSGKGQGGGAAAPAPAQPAAPPPPTEPAPAK